MRGLHVRWNSSDDCFLYLGNDDELRVIGVMRIIGFEPGEAAILRCYFERDESLPDGTVELRPIRP